MLSKRVCVCVCVCKSSATEAHNFPTCGIGGEGLVKVETNYTTPHPRIKSINKSQKQQGQQQRKQEQQRQPMERGKRKKKRNELYTARQLLYFPVRSVRKSLVHNTFNLPSDKQRTPNTNTISSSPLVSAKNPKPSFSLPCLALFPPSAAPLHALAYHPLPLPPFLYLSLSPPPSVFVVFARVAFLCCHLFRHLCKTLLLSLVLWVPWDLLPAESWRLAKSKQKYVW